ncbi:transporter substrate-binding domain-containing protein [Litorilituus sediminis]|uniref:Transporter substrate-binding domain-containing protein n=2 Tax=Litorilituus sediminis TaxID=718192 RepID=A0A4P6PDI1_9GAMM|nr:transporter substrate-binding domain-containing protein [Litorilituus sediminis]
MCTVQAESLDKVQVRTIAIAPYGINSGQELSGIYYDIANSIVKTSGLQAEHAIYPYARIVHELKVGLTDITIMYRYQELEGYVTYIAPLPTLKNVVIGVKGTHFADIASLRGKRLAYLRGAQFNQQIDNDKQINKYLVKDFDQAVHMLAAGRVDAVIGPLDPLINSALTAGKKDFFGPPLVVSQRTPWLQISNKSRYKSSTQQFKKIFNNMVQRGELAKLRQKYNMLDITYEQ